jgi:hypothetical protein
MFKKVIDMTWLLVKEIESVFQGDKFNDGREIHEMIFLFGMETCVRYYYFSCLVKEKGMEHVRF